MSRIIAANYADLLLQPSSQAQRVTRCAFLLSLLFLLALPVPLLVKVILIAWLCRVYPQAIAEVKAYRGRLQFERQGAVAWQGEDYRWRGYAVLLPGLLLFRLVCDSEPCWLWVFADSCRREDFHHLSLMAKHPERDNTTRGV
ncbi:protein YgfX [Thaumasiovibrio subtropicus]|uniref:protein YgfX n=1 Tax=Thaumasiovibrio subtropicus TaxID=1891207 RepID=UPI00131B0595|nr:protein YgfX [Thaumasiovibrio subtropicus]